MKKMNIEINGVTLQADFMDADFMEIFEPALYEVRDRANRCKTQKTGMVAGAFKELNSCIETFSILSGAVAHLNVFLTEVKTFWNI